MSPLDYALMLAVEGFAVFPVGQDKAPRCPRGHKAASTEPERVRTMAAQFGFVLVGVATGEASKLAVLDVDRQHGGLNWYDANRERLPETFTYRTRSGGLHLWFQHKPGLRCSTARIAPGIDVKAEGGACTYWPAAGFEVLCGAPMADWPEWLTPPEKPTPEPPALPVFTGETAARRYAEAAMRRAIIEVSTAPAGQRNQGLNAATYSLLRLVETGAVTTREVASAMAHAGIAAGLEPREVQATIASALASRRAAR